MDRRRSTRLSGENAVNGLTQEESRGEADGAGASASGSATRETAGEPVMKKQRTAGGLNVRRGGQVA
jgi:hypothetical protein